MLGIDEGNDPTGPLRVGGNVVAERRLPARLGTEDLRDPAARHTAHSERQVERDGAGGYHLDGHLGALVAESHDRAASELLLDLQDGGIHGTAALTVTLGRGLGLGGCHRGVHAVAGSLLFSLRAADQVKPPRLVRCAACASS